MGQFADDRELKRNKDEEYRVKDLNSKLGSILYPFAFVLRLKWLSEVNKKYGN